MNLKCLRTFLILSCMALPGISCAMISSQQEFAKELIPLVTKSGSCHMRLVEEKFHEYYEKFRQQYENFSNNPCIIKAENFLEAGYNPKELNGFTHDKTNNWQQYLRAHNIDPLGISDKETWAFLFSDGTILWVINESNKKLISQYTTAQVKFAQELYQNKYWKKGFTILDEEKMQILNSFSPEVRNKIKDEYHICSIEEHKTYLKSKKMAERKDLIHDCCFAGLAGCLLYKKLYIPGVILSLGFGIKRHGAWLGNNRRNKDEFVASEIGKLLGTAIMYGTAIGTGLYAYMQSK